MSEPYTPPTEGSRVTIDAEGGLLVPDIPVIPFIEGDGIGPDIWRASRRVFDAAVASVYGGARRIVWYELFAGQKARELTGEWLPERTIEEIRRHVVAIKGPLTTPVGRGLRSLNVAIRQRLDLYACIRPARWLQGAPTPLKDPGKLDIVIYRENTEGTYAGIEFAAGTDEAAALASLLDQLGKGVRAGSGIGIKAMSAFGAERLVRKALTFAVKHGRRRVTVVHSGNLMKFTEGAFRDHAYQVAKRDFADTVITEEELWDEYGGRAPEGRIVLDDRIADGMFQQLLLRPTEYDVIATTNLNGDYLSHAAVAQVGGVGMAPGAHIGDAAAVFEATHGTAPKYADQDKVNPSSLLLSGVMMMEHLGWDDAAAAIVRGIERTIGQGRVTYDLARQMEGATLTRCSEFASAIIDNL